MDLSASLFIAASFAMPDESHCCSFCGFGLQVNNAK